MCPVSKQAEIYFRLHISDFPGIDTQYLHIFSFPHLFRAGFSPIETSLETGFESDFIEHQTGKGS